MREGAHRLLAIGAEPLPDGALEILRLQLRGHIELLIPEVERAALGLPKDDIPRACALACTGEARMRLRLGPGDLIVTRVSVVQKLSRSVRALCDHLENLGGGHQLRTEASA
ncbi:DUF6415 family natural product biosynthesis protein [Streptomyces sp. NPDC001978]|uniref:DUF6415 family natural product biosynthesis protein n=1 Tax=Streptomyces sp. NPDC001978 TaxID=3364627 RepID=UPI0036B19557